jgi:hypothetical protein
MVLVIEFHADDSVRLVIVGVNLRISLRILLDIGYGGSLGCRPIDSILRSFLRINITRIITKIAILVPVWNGISPIHRATSIVIDVRACRVVSIYPAIISIISTQEQSVARLIQFMDSDCNAILGNIFS